MNNYTLTETRELPEIKALGHLYEHKNGAKIVYIKCEDENKVFSAAFRTPPFDETGLPHILEHCVLAGSEKYPAKEPFNELIKGSLHTYLNAMTFTDKTMYPIASCNDKDFLNLMDVYLDSVFFPMIYKRKESFLQEAWHFDSDGKNSPLQYNGIVYNEMKGAYSDPYDTIDMLYRKCLFPDTCYGLDSGGNPEHIPDLTYEDFLKFHKQYYIPENCYMYFYGNMDIEACFENLDKNYLSKFEKTGRQIEIKEQKPLDKPAFATGLYSLADTVGADPCVRPSTLPDEQPCKNYIAASFVAEGAQAAELYHTMDLLIYILMQTPASPLKKALLEQGIGEDVHGEFNDSCISPTINIIVKNSKYTAEKLKEVIFSTLSDLVKNGIDKKMVEACINRFEFQYKEEEYGNTPKGLVYNMTLLTSWLYDGNPFDKLEPLAYLQKIRQKCGGDYFEKLIEKYILKNPHSAYVTLFPDTNLDNENEKKLKLKLENIKNSLTQKELDKIHAEGEALLKYQETPDTAEVLEAVPLLNLTDIKKEALHIPLEQKQSDGCKILHTPLDTNDIAYVSFFFDTKKLDRDLLQSLSIYLYLLGKLDTERFSYVELNNEINESLGGLQFGFELFENKITYMPFVKITAKALSKNMPQIFSLTNELIGHTKFGDKQRIRTLMSEMKAKIQASHITKGHTLAFGRALSYFSEAGAYKQLVNGIDFYEQLSSVLENFDEQFPKLQAEFAELQRRIFNKNNITFSATLDEGMYQKFAPLAHDFYNNLHNETLDDCTIKFDLTAQNEAFITSSKVQYNAQAANFGVLGYEYGGLMRVLSKIISEGYLLEQIRVKGGAYGYGSQFMRNGAFYFYSYRDPKLSETYDVFAQASSYVSAFDANAHEMTKYILGTINGIDRPLSNAKKGEFAAAYHFMGVTQQMLQAERDEILSATPEKIRNLCGLLEQCTHPKHVCTFGGENMINSDKKIFKNIKKL